MQTQITLWERIDKKQLNSFINSLARELIIKKEDVYFFLHIWPDGHIEWLLDSYCSPYRSKYILNGWFFEIFFTLDLFDEISFEKLIFEIEDSLYFWIENLEEE